MKKIPSLFPIINNRHDTTKIREGTEWVLTGEGIARRKYDGTACMFENGKYYRRYQIKKGKVAPEGFKLADVIDPNTGKQVGWVPVGEGPESKWHREAILPTEDGTYELIGPKIENNHDNVDKYILMRHDTATAYDDFPRDVSKMEKYIDDLGIEGVVIYGNDGKMVKVKSKDFKDDRRDLRTIFYR